MKESFGEYVRKKRESLGKTMRVFANEVGISPAYLSDIEKGHRNPPESKLELFLSALSITEKDDIHKFYDLAGSSRMGTQNGQHYDINAYMQKVPQSRVVLRTANDNKWTNADWQKLLELYENNK